MHIVLRRIGLAAAYAVSLLLIAWSLPAMFIGIFRIGSLLPFGLGIVLTIAVAKRKSLARLTGAGRVVLRIGIAGLCCFAAAFVVTSICMLHAVGRPVRPGATVIVAGTQIHGSTPSLSLQRRLDAAVEYLNEYPNAPCVVSGGQGSGEDCSEAEAMAVYLVEKGIDESRIYQEDRSQNTSQNMLYSAELIRQHDLPKDVAIATEAFHQLRCQMFAEKNGLRPGAVASTSPWYVQHYYWWREIFGLAKAVVFGN